MHFDPGRFLQYLSSKADPQLRITRSDLVSALIPSMADPPLTVDGDLHQIDASLFVPHSRPRLFIIAAKQTPGGLIQASPAEPFHSPALRNLVDVAVPAWITRAQPLCSTIFWAASA